MSLKTYLNLEKLSEYSHYFSYQFRGPELLKGAFARGILQNNAGMGYLKKLVEDNGYKSTPYLTDYIVTLDKKRIEDEEEYGCKEIRRRLEMVRVAKRISAAEPEGSYKSGTYD